MSATGACKAGFHDLCNSIMCDCDCGHDDNQPQDKGGSS